MSAGSTIRDTDAMRVRRIRISHPDWSAGRVLSALGHPGYGDSFAVDVLGYIEHKGYDAFRAVSHAYNERGVRW